MKAKVFLTILLNVSYMYLWSQDIEPDNLRNALFEFLISKGDYEKGIDTEGVLLIINDVSSLEEFNKQQTGVFKFGTLTSHSYFHVFLKGKKGCTIVDLKKPYENVVLILLKYFQRNQEYTKEEVLCYIRSVTELYKKNQEVTPWEVPK